VKVSLAREKEPLCRIGNQFLPECALAGGSTRQVFEMTSGDDFARLLLPQADVMSLLILLSVPALAGIICMAIAMTNQVLYPRLKAPEGRVSRPALVAHPRRRKAA